MYMRRQKNFFGETTFFFVSVYTLTCLIIVQQILLIFQEKTPSYMFYVGKNVWILNAIYYLH